VARDAKHALGDTCAGHMEHQKQRDAETKAELPPLPTRKAQIASHVNRPQRIQIMGQQRRYQNGGSNCGPPRIHEDVESSLRTRERKQQKGVGRQVADHEGEQDESADETEVVPQHPRVPTRRHAFREFGRDVWLALSNHRFGICAWAKHFPCSIGSGELVSSPTILLSVADSS
jgi:hypothetical protein